MLMSMISKLVNIVFGLLYPAYSSYIVVKNKDVRGYVHWMMYWIVYAFYSASENFTDTFIGSWFPFYHEIKIAFTLWLMSPATSGAGTIYRRFLHPKLLKYEPEIDACIVNIKNQTSNFVFQWAARVFGVVANTCTETFWNTALRAGGAQFLNQLRRTQSLDDLDAADGDMTANMFAGLWSPPRVRSRAYLRNDASTSETDMVQSNNQQLYERERRYNEIVLEDDEEIYNECDQGEVDKQEQLEEVEAVITEGYRTRGSRRKHEAQATSVYGAAPRRKNRKGSSGRSRRQ